MPYTGKQYAVTTSAVHLGTILGITDRIYPVQVDIKNAKGNTGTVYLGKSNVTNVPANAFASLSADQAWSFVPGTGSRHLTLDEIFVVGSNATDPVFITVIY